MTLERTLCHPEYFGLTTATPLQRAICRIADGLPLGELANHPDVRTAIGDVEALPECQPRELYLFSGIRTGKSLLAAALAVRATQTVDISKLGRGETARVSVLSVKLDQAKVIYDHILGNVQASPWLRQLLVGEPAADSIIMRHPTGRPVEIKVVAGSRAGSSVVARWSAGVIFDEAPRMVGADSGVVNFDDSRAAALGRLLPGAQLVAIGSPWAPFGPMYSAFVESWGKPSRHLVVIKAPASAMNPVTWTPDAIEELRVTDPAVYRTDILGEFADMESAMFLHDQLQACTRQRLRREPEPRRRYWAAMDPATRGNAWTLAIGALDDHGKVVVDVCQQWQGSALEPLSPASVMADISQLMHQYGCLGVTTDQYSADAMRDLGHRYGVNVLIDTISTMNKVEMFKNLAYLVSTGNIELPPDRTVLEDLRRVRQVVTQSGVRIELPATRDGRHADYAPAVALLAKRCQAEPEVEDKRPDGWCQWELDEVDRIIERNRERRGESFYGDDWEELDYDD